MLNLFAAAPLALNRQQDKKVTITSCALCGGGCQLKVIESFDGSQKIMGDSDDPVSQGQLCRKGRNALAIMNHPDRLTQPLMRIGQRGDGHWQAVSWQEAINYTAERLAQTQQQWGDNSVFLAYGHSKDFINTQLLRLANGMNTANIVGPETVCWAPTKLGREYTLGYSPSHDINEQTQCIMFWGVNKYHTRFSEVKTLKRALKAGASSICIDPQKTKHAQQADLWLRVAPGSDLSLGLAMLKVIIEEDLYDHDFVANWCVGFEWLQQQLSCYSFERLAQDAQLEISQIQAAARTYAQAKPAVIVSGNALDHNSDSFQVNRVIAILMAITGNVDVPGGQFHNQEASLITGRWPYDDQEVNALSQVERDQSAGTPVIPEYFRATNQGITDAILHNEQNPVKAGFVVGANPLLSWPDTRKVHQALKALDFLAVSELFMTPTAMMADIVFPAASFMEYEGLTQGNDGAIRYQPKLGQVGDAKPDHQIIAAIGEALGVFETKHDRLLEQDPFKHFQDEAYWNLFLQPSGVDFTALKAKQRSAPTPPVKQYRKYLHHGFSTPSGKVELYSKALVQLGADPLPAFKPMQAVKNSRYPLLLTTAKSKHYMFSHGRQIAALRDAHPNPLVRLHPETASSFGLIEGDSVRIEAESGQAIYQQLKLDPDLALNVVVADLSWWYPELGYNRLGDVFESNYNVLTNGDDDGRGLGEAGSFNINGIRVRLSKEWVR